MELTNEFEVPVDPSRAWAVLTDLERIAPCLPGAQLTDVDGDVHRGSVKIRVGPIVATYEGEARFVERDEANGRVVLDASGRDRRQGNASAIITATMREAPGGGTLVALTTDLRVAGKVAQFGRGVLSDVSEKLLGEFVTNLERDVLSLSEDDGPGIQSGAVHTDGSPRVAGEVRPVDLLDAAGPSVLKRILPVVGVFVALLAFRRLLRGTRGLPDLAGLTGIAPDPDRG